MNQATPATRVPMAAPCFALMAGIAFARMTGMAWREAAVAAAMVGLLGAVAWYRRERRAVWLAGLAMFGCFGAMLEIGARPAAVPLLDAKARETVLAEGCVVAPPAWFTEAATVADNRVRFALELTPGARANMNVYLRPGEATPALRYGDRVEVTARFRPIRNYGNPGAFDAAGYFGRREVFWNGSASGAGSVKRLPGHCGSAWRGAVFAMRGWLLERTDRLFADAANPQTVGTMRALLVGDATRLDESDAESYRRAGVYHTLVVSGLHLAAIGAILLFFLRVVHAGVSAAFLWTVAVAWLYAAICGFAAPVVRAALGLTLYATGRWFYRAPNVLNVLATTVCVFLIADPAQLFEASFQLSFFAVALIAGFAVPVFEGTWKPMARAFRHLSRVNADFACGPRWAEFRVELRLLAEACSGELRLPQRWILLAVGVAGRVFTWVVESALLTIAVQVGMALPMIAYFHRFPLAGITSNLTVAPLMTAAVPAGLAAVVTGSGTLAGAVSWAVETSQVIADWHARIESSLGEASSRVPPPPDWLAACFALSLASLCFAVLRIRAAAPGELLAGIRIWRAASALAFAAALLAVVIHPFPPALRTGKLELTAIDVGQGDSLLAVSPGGATMLIDTGGTPDFSGAKDRPPSFDVGEEVVSPYLWSRGIRRLDVVAVTHPDADHAGGVRAILENFRPAELWMGADLPPETIAFARQLGVVIRRPRAGASFDWDGANVDILGPPEAAADDKVNNRSLVVRLAYGRHSFLLTGDIERGAEYDLLNAQRVAPATVLKVAHHGSRTSTTPEFLAAARPAIAVISAGHDNLYGHPHPDVMKRVRESTRHVMRTDERGLVSFFTDGRYLESATGIQ